MSAQKQQASGWAVCHNTGGVMLFTVRSTRKEAIHAFMAVAEGKGKENLWRKYRGEGWRASHVSIEERLFQKESTDG